MPWRPAGNRSQHQACPMPGMCQEMQRVPQVGKDRPDAGVEAPQAWAVLPGTPSPFLPGFLPKPFLETQPTQPPIRGPMFPWWLTGPGQAGPFLSLSILRVWENSLVGRRSTPRPQPTKSHPTKSFIAIEDHRCLLTGLFSCYTMGSTNYETF